MKDILKKEKFFNSLFGNTFEYASIILINILLVPIFLKYWSTEAYASWIIFITAKGFLTTIYLAHSNFVYYENLKDGIKKKKIINERISSAIITSILFTILFFFISIYEIKTNKVGLFFKINNEFLKDWSFYLSLYILLYGLIINIKNFYIGPISIIQKFHIHSWFKGLSTFLIYSILCMSVIFGYNFKNAIKLLLQLEVLSTIIYIIYFYNFLKKENFYPVKPNIKKSFDDFFKSKIILLTYIMDFFKFNGVRFLVNIFSGPIQLVIFTTVRTLANSLNQLFIIIEKPLLPLIMNNKKDSNLIKINQYNFIFIVAILNPLIFFIQYIAPFIFELWTLNKINFDPLLFLFLTCSIIFMYLSMPIDKIITGNNYIFFNLFISINFLIFILLFFYFFTKIEKLYIIGVGFLFSEIIITNLKFVFIFKKLVKLKKIKQNLLIVNVSIFLLILFLSSVHILNFNKIIISIIFLILNYSSLYLLFKNKINYGS
jgi:O-antigen/teichoic acid export membrane protein